MGSNSKINPGGGKTACPALPPSVDTCLGGASGEDICPHHFPLTEPPGNAALCVFINSQLHEAPLLVFAIIVKTK